MRTRNYVVRGKLPWSMTQNLTRYKSDGSGDIQLPNPWQQVIFSGSDNVNHLHASGTITDMVRTSRSSKFEVHPCTHTKVKAEYNGPSAQMTMEGKTSDNLNVWVFQQHSPLAYILAYMPNSLSDAFISGASSSDYTAGDYVKPDWFAVQESFREACDSFIPSDLMLGETLIEYGIFADAIKIALNPTKILPSFIKLVKDYGLEKSNLGKIRRTLKHASRGTLSYSFAIKPAIEDIRSIFGAHGKVSARLDYLSRNGGQFVPVRAVKKHYASISNSNIDPVPGAFERLRKQCDYKETAARANAWGRVREEINYRDTWKAYVQYFGLNQVVGLAWELIPFSFVLDWFTNTQERIRYLTSYQSGSPFTEFRGFSYSLKETLQESVYYIPGRNATLTGMSIVTPNKPELVFFTKKSSYSRYLTIPSTSGVVDMSTLGLFHAITGGALMIQRFLR